MSTTPNAEATQTLLSLCEDRARWPRELTPDAVRKLLSEGADVNGRGKYGSTPLHLAVLAPYTKSDLPPNLDVVRTLLEAGADPNARDTHAQTPLLRAVPLNDDASYEAHALELIHLLRAAGARVPDDVTGGNAGAFRFDGTPRLYAELLDAGARIDVRDDSGATPLHRVAAFGKAPVAELLLARGANVNAIDGLGRTPLGIALRTREQVWVKANNRTMGFNALISLLERAGGQPRVPYARHESDPFAPLPINSATLRAALPKFPFKHEVDSAQEFITGLHSCGEPEKSLSLLEALRDVLDMPPRHLRLAGPLRLTQPFFHHGDLEVDGHLDIGKAFAVTGHLTVHGVLRDCGNDSLVNVLKDVRCHALYTDGELNVLGDIHARDVVLGYYNDHVLTAGGIYARVVIEDDHAFNASVQAEHHFDIDTYQQGYGDGVPERLRELFVDEVFDDEGQLDKGELFGRIRDGLPVFRERP